MSSFLWVEDFETATVPATVRGVFGSLPGDLCREIPGDRYDLQDHIDKFKEHRIEVAFSLAHALSIIESERINEFDFVVLDIDLQPFDAAYDEEAYGDLVRPLVDRWYSSTNGTDWRRDLKRIAGYHLWTNLVIDKGFPNDRILFCSNHGEHLQAIEASFGVARIDSPRVLSKDDPAAKHWVQARAAESYSLLRRAVIDRCADLEKRVRHSTEAADFVRYRWMAEDGDRALEYLQTLPLLLPAWPQEAAKSRLLKSFCRALTGPWDGSHHPIAPGDADDIAYENIFYLLKHARNAFSHSLDHLNDTDERVAAFLLLLAMRSLFQFDPGLTADERRLARIFSSVPELPCDREVSSRLRSSLQKAQALGSNCRGYRSFIDVLRCLQLESVPHYLKVSRRLIFQLYFHQLFNFKDGRILVDPRHRRWVKELGTMVFNEAFE